MTMKRSTDRILVTHVGSLVRPMSIRNILSARDHGEPYDEAAYEKTLQEEVAGVVRKQADIGIDIVSDGEYGKAGWIRYVSERLGGFVHRPIPRRRPRAEPGLPDPRGREVQGILRGLHADPVLRLAAARRSRRPARQARSRGLRKNLMVWECVAPITYKGQAAIAQDIDNFKSALERREGRRTRSCRSPRR